MALTIAILRTKYVSMNASEAETLRAALDGPWVHLIRGSHGCHAQKIFRLPRQTQILPL